MEAPATTTHKCSKCDQSKPPSEFTKNRKAPGGLAKWCRDCCAHSNASWYRNNSDRAKAKAAAWYRENKARARERHRLWLEANPDAAPRKCQSRYQRLRENPKLEWSKQAVRNARDRAKGKGLEFDLDAAFVASVAPDFCPVLGIRLAYPDGDRQIMGGSGDSASIDRLDNARGYVRDNIAVISRRANAIKTDAAVHEVRAVLKWMEKTSADSGPRALHVASGGN